MSKRTALSKRVLAALLSSMLAVSAFVPVVQARPTFIYPDGMDHVAVSSASSVFNTESVQADGSVYAGKNLDFYGTQNMTVSGTLGAKGTVSGHIQSNGEPQSGRAVPELQEGIQQSAEYSTSYAGDALIEGKTIDLTTDSVYAAGTLHLDEVTLDGSGYVTAGKDLICDLIDGAGSEAGSVLYSETGDVIISGSDLTINGIVYAPSGRIVLNAKHLTVNGALYAQDIIVNGTELSLNQVEQYDYLVTARLTVEAGPDREVYAGESLMLEGECNFANAELYWSADSSILFDDNSEPITSARFTEEGTYVLTLAAVAGTLKASDTLTVKVLPSPAKQFTVDSDFAEGQSDGTEAADDQLTLGQEEQTTAPIETEYTTEGASGIHVKRTISKDRITGPVDSLSVTYDLTGIGTPVSAEEQGVDFIFVIDNSGSMYGTYLENVQIAAKTMLEYMHTGDRYAITDLGKLHIGFTDDREVLEQEIDRIKSGSGSSEMDDGIVIANKLFDTDSSEKRLKYILLLTDGEDCYNYSIERMHEVAQESADRGIKVFSIAMHGEMEAMQDIASITKGIYKHCPDAETIGNIMEQFANEIFNTAARNVVFKTTVQDFSLVDTKNISPSPFGLKKLDNDAAELTWNLEAFDIDTQKTITLPLRSETFATDGMALLTTDTALYYNDKEGVGQKIYLDDINLPCDAYAEEGTWTAVYDSKRVGCPWTGIHWNASFPSDSSAEIYVSVSEDNLAYTEEKQVDNYNDLAGLKGRYIRVKAVLHRSVDGYTPEIKDLTVISGTLTLSEPPTAVFAANVKANGRLYANKPITLSGQVSSSAADARELVWSVEGTENYTIDTADLLHPVITFAEAGEYTVKLTVSDGTHQAESSVVLPVKPEEKVADVVYDTSDGQSVQYAVEWDNFKYVPDREVHTLRLVTPHPEAIAWVSVRFVSDTENFRNSGYNRAWVYSVSEDLESEYTFPYYYYNYVGRLVVTAYDWNGEAYPTEYQVVRDSVRPTVSITLPASLYPNNRFFTEDPFTVTVNASDDWEIDELILTVNGEKVELSEDNTYTFTPTEQTSYEFRADVRDKAGNTAYANNRTYIYQDTTPPSFYPFSLNRSYAYIGNEIIFKAEAKDDQTGLRSFAYYLDDEPITLDENNEYRYIAEEAGDFVFKAEAEDNRGNKAERTLNLRVAEDTSRPYVSIRADRNREMVVNTPVTFTITASDNVAVTKMEAEINGKTVKINKDNQITYRPTETGTLKLTVNAYDKVGNMGTGTYQLTVLEADTTEPTISGWVAERYEYNDRTSTVSFTISDNTEVAIRTIYLDGVKIEEPENTGATPKYSYTDRISFVPTEIGLGQHTIKVVGKDRAGNRAEKVFPFTVSDTTQPNISLGGSSYYNMGDTMTVTVNISDFSELASVTADLNGTPVTMTTDKEQTVTFENAEPGTYVFTITAKDTAGNERTATRNLTVRDTEKPVITLSDVQQEYFMPEVPVIKVSATDNVGVTSLEATLNYAALTIEDGQIIMPEEMTEGNYTLRVTARDAAGNSVTETVTFHYGPYRDTTPPTITNILLTPNTPDVGTPLSLIISATDDSGSVDITVTLPDGTPIIGENGTFTYTPTAAGQLVFKVTAADPSGNYSAQQVTVTVIEDAQAPVVSVNAPASMKLGDTLNLTVNATDNKAVTKTGLLCNDQEVTLSENTYAFTPSKEGEYTFMAYALDAQGNRGEKSFVITVVDQPTDEQLKEYLVIEDETVLGEDAAAKADELKTAAGVYEFVKNNVQTQFYSGSRKGAKATFEQLGGNDTDIASLTIGMLRHLGYPARYVTGRVSYTDEEMLALTGVMSVQSAREMMSATDDRYKMFRDANGTVTMEVTRTWVEVYAPLSETGAKSAEKAWITLTPDNKSYEYKAVESKQNFTDSRKDTAEKILEDIKELEANGIQVDFSQTKAACHNTIEAEDPTITLQDKYIKQQKITVLPASAEISIKSKTNNYTNLPDSLSDTLSFTIAGGIYNYDIVDDKLLGTLKTSDVSGKRILIQYLPAYESDKSRFESAKGNWKSLSGMMVKPTLTVDGEIIGQGPAVSVGTTQTLISTVKCSGEKESLNDKIVAGSMYAIVPNLYDISAKDIETAFATAKENALADTEYGPYSEEYLGSLLDCAGKMYFSLNDIYEVLHCETYNIALISKIALGIFSYHFCTETNFMGQISGVTDGNFQTDIGLNPYYSFSMTGNKDDVVKFSLCNGAMGSYLESFIWEYILDVPAISTMSALATAVQEGIDILYINAEDIDEVLPTLEATSEVISDIRSYVQKGYLVVIPQKKLTVGDWTGTGYIITNPDTDYGHSIFRVSGGLNGGSAAEESKLDKIVNDPKWDDIILDDEKVAACFQIRVLLGQIKIYMAAYSIATGASAVAAGGLASILGAMSLANAIQSYSDGITAIFESCDLFIDYAAYNNEIAGRKLVVTCLNDICSFGFDMFKTVAGVFIPGFETADTIWSYIDSLFHITEWE